MCVVCMCVCVCSEVVFTIMCCLAWVSHVVFSPIRLEAAMSSRRTVSISFCQLNVDIELRDATTEWEYRHPDSCQLIGFCV